MFWCDKLLEKIEEPQLINDSKTPSGRVHVGSLRGVLIHDAIFRSLKEKGIPVRYIFGVDDYDPVDEIPDGEGEHFKNYLGYPLCNAPAPPGSEHTDMASHYISEFFDVFKELDVETEAYRMRDVYRSGQFNEVIDIILSHAEVVRKIYRDVSHSERANNWYPFQAICENCGRIGTTEVTDYDKNEVTYTCRPDMVTWATGCGHTGRISPFDGNGKLPWKLEWVAKWKVFDITLEGAGKDHSTKGGSRDVSAKCLKEIFNQRPPLNVPYEFFLVDGAKMSSSKGLGVTARAMSDFLPAEILRFLMLRTQPNRPVNFSPSEKNITKVFNDFDRFHHRVHEVENVPQDEKRIYQLSKVNEEGGFYQPNFQLLSTLVQMPHLNVVEEIEKHKGSELTSVEKQNLNRRIQAVRYWVDNLALEEEKTRLQDKLPENAAQLGEGQRAFLCRLATELEATAWNAEDLQTTIFEVSRLTPIKQSLAFRAIYCTLLDRESGPKAGNLLSVLEPEFVKKRFKELSYSEPDFWLETAITIGEFENWMDKEQDRINDAFAVLQISPCASSSKAGHDIDQGSASHVFVEFYFTMDDSKKLMKRILYDRDMAGHSNNGKPSVLVNNYIKELNESKCFSIAGV